MPPAAARLLRSFFALAVTAMLLTVPVRPVAVAQTADDVRQAAEERDTARQRAADAAGDEAATVAALLDAAAAYDEVTAELSGMIRTAANLAEATVTVEAEVRSLRAAARDLVTAAYISGDDDLSLLFSADSLLDALVARDVIDRAAGRHLVLFEELEASREDLAIRRADLETAAIGTSLLRREADVLADRLAALAGAAAGALREATADAAIASRQYELTAAAYEALVNSIGPATARWRGLVERSFPEDLVWEALAVMQCESNGVPDAVNATSSATGLFQFLPGTWAYASVAAGYEGADARDPDANVAAAAWLVSHSGLIDHPLGPWGPWECRPGGAFLAWPPAISDR